MRASWRSCCARDCLHRCITGKAARATLQELVRSYAVLTEDTTRVMGRLKALYRSQAIACAGKKPYGRRHRREWLSKLNEAGLHRRAERLYEELDALQGLRRAAKRELGLESRKHAAAKLLRTVPLLGAIRAALLIGRVQTPHRFRSKRQFWAYCGLALETRSSADYRFEDGQLVRGVHPRTQPQPQSRSEKPVQECGDDGQRHPRPLP